MEDAQLIFSNIVAIASFHIVNPNQQRIIHYTDLLQELGVPAKLFGEQRSLLRSKLEPSSTMDPVQVFERSLRVLFRLFFRVFPTPSRAFEVIRLVDIAMRGKQVVHDDEMDFSSSWQFHSM